MVQEPVTRPHRRTRDYDHPRFSSDVTSENETLLLMVRRRIRQPLILDKRGLVRLSGHCEDTASVRVDGIPKLSALVRARKRRLRRVRVVLLACAVGAALVFLLGYFAAHAGGGAGSWRHLLH